jgi:hypothetical protein
MVIKMKEIADYILQKLGDRVFNKEHNREYGGLYIITTDGKLYGLDKYEDLIEEDPSTSRAYIFVMNLWFSYEPGLYYPFIGEGDLLLEFYLRKHYYHITHFSDLKYVATIIHFSVTNEAFMEIVDLEIAANNTNMPKLIQLLNEVNDEDDEYEKLNELEERFKAQELFNGYDFYQAYKIIDKYYKENDKSLASEVKAIEGAYHSIFQPYHVKLSPGV